MAVAIALLRVVLIFEFKFLTKLMDYLRSKGLKI